MVTLVAINRNYSETFTRTINPRTKEEFNKDIKNFEKFVNKIFTKWHIEFDTFSATFKQTDWCEEKEMT